MTKIAIIGMGVMGKNHYRGYAAQHSSPHSIDDKCIEIGSNNIFRENCTIHQPFRQQKTIIADNNFFMVNVHIAHDCLLHSNITIANNTALAGHTTIYDFANIGLNVCIHQFSTIGQFTMIGMGSIIIKDVLPFNLVTGDREIKTSLNIIGFQRKYKGKLILSDIKNYKKYINKNKILPQNLGNELDEILEPFKNSHNGFYC